MIAFKYLLLPLFVVSCGAFENSEEENVQTTAQLSNMLASDLYHELSSGDDNIFFSPFSISVALAMLYHGTRGETASEMKRILAYDDSQLSDRELHSAFHSILKLYGTVSDQYDLYVANALLTQKNFTIREEYKTTLEKMYLARARDVDFANEGRKVLQEINDWVKQATRNQISQFLSNIDPTTALILLNAVYFKGTWKTQFDAKNTVKRTFYNAGSENSKVTAPFMKVTQKFPYARLGGFRVLELPYQGEDISMVILLPNERNGLPRLERELNHDMIKNLRRNLRESEIHLTFPKFKLTYEKALKASLQRLGLKSIFRSDADLSGISEVRNLFVSAVSHKAVIEVNEKGSEASAITGIIVDVRFPMPPLDNEFVADHPFLFAIVDNRNEMILFQGRLNKL